MSQITIYGLPNCDNTAKALRLLRNKNAVLHNYKIAGISKQKIQDWVTQFGFEKILNKKSTTWRSLTVEQQQTVVDDSTAIKLMYKHTNLIKRPIVEAGSSTIIGLELKQLSLLK
jgi:arsenate reductase (glutaredoxin)